MTTIQMAYFIAMAEKLSFTVVADMFYVTQPTLSRQIMNLETELETQLFVRKNNIVTLTLAGETLYDGLKPIYGQLNRLISTVQRFHERPRPVFTIGVAQELLLDDAVQLAIGIFSASNTEMDIRIARATHAGLESGLLDGSFNVANTITSSFDMSSGRFGFLCIEEERVHLACSRELAKSLPPRISISQLMDILRKNKLLLGSNDSFGSFGERESTPIDIFKEGFGPLDFEPELQLCGSPLNIPDQVASGLGVSLCNKTNMFAIDPRTAIVEIDVAPKRGTIYPKGLIYNLADDSPTLRHFLRIVQDRLKVMSENE